MSQPNSQFAIINKIKNIVRRTGHLFSANHNNGITEAIARKIQKSAYVVTHSKEEAAYTPPYLLIAEQLQSHDEQIFRGAVYYLSRIAVNEPKNRETIIDILGRCIDNSKRDQTQLDYIKSKIAEIRQAAAEKPKA